MHGPYVRGLSSRPGAPQADPARNIGAAGGPAGLGSLRSDLTPKSNWESIFRNFVTGQNTATGAGGSALPSALPTPPTPPSGWGLNNNFRNPGAPVPPNEQPSLETIASGGATPHMDRWQQKPFPSKPMVGTANPLAGTGYETGNVADILNKYASPTSYFGVTSGEGHSLGSGYVTPEGKAFGWGAFRQLPNTSTDNG